VGQLAVSAAGAVVGWFIGGPTGAQWGWAIGGVVGAAFAPTQKSQGPRLNDLRIMGTEYGQPIPWVKGHPRLAPQVIWASERREIATTTEQGKGGGAEYTTYTYEVDMLLKVSDNPIAGIGRIWDNGKLVYNPLSTADADTRRASAETERWQRISVYVGDEDQLPDPDYEEAVGSGNAPAYRGSGTVFIKSLKLGGSGQIPNLTIEVISKGTSNEQSEVLFQACFRDNSTQDESIYQHETTLGSNAGATSDQLQCVGPNPAGPDRGLTATVSNTAGGAWAIEMQVDASVLPESGDAVNLFTWGSVEVAGIQVFASMDEGLAFLQIISTSTGGQLFSIGSTIFHLALSCTGGTNATVTVYINGNPAHSYVYGASASHAGGELEVLAYASSQIYFVSIDDIRISSYHRYPDPFTVPPSPLPLPRGIQVVTIQEETLEDVVEALCLRAGLAASQFDLTQLASVTKPVRAMAIAQVTGTRPILEQLAAAYFFECVLSDKLYFRLRGGSSVAAIPYEDLGASTDPNGSREPFEIHPRNELELPAAVALTYRNVDVDYNNDTQQSDRLVVSQASAATVDLAMGFTASEAKGIADAMQLDQQVALLATKLPMLEHYSRLEPTDVVVVTGADGSAFRLRLTELTKASGVLAFEAVLDDASVLTGAGITSNDYSPSITVPGLSDTMFNVLDIALLMDEHDGPGLYVAAKGTRSPYPGAAVFKSLDDVTYEQVLTVGEQAIMGLTTTVLGTWSGGNVFDEANSVTVNVVSGTLSSATHAEVLDAEANACLIGDEILQFKNAALISTGVYKLTGLLRGRRGTEWARADHAINERFVLLQTAGMRRLSLETPEIGATRYFKGVTLGRQLSTANAVEQVCECICLKPFSPVDLRASHQAADSTVLLLHGNGTNGSTTFTDSSGLSKTVTGFGNAQLSTSSPKFGSAAIVLDGTGDYLSVGAAADWKFLHDGTKWTLQLWFKAASFASAQAIIDTAAGTTSNAGIYLAIDTSRQIFVQIYRAVSSSYIINGTLTGSSIPNDGAYHHLEITFDHSLASNNFVAYIDGVSAGALTKSGDAPSSAEPGFLLNIGRSNGGTAHMNGTIDDFEIRSGEILHTSNFTPPSAEIVDPTPGSNNLALTWSRRTRLATNFSNGNVPLGEVSEAYEVDIFTDSTYSVVARTIGNLSTPAATYSAADQLEDFGSVQSTIYVRVYQISQAVGRGYYLQGAV
jgi:hypothetical protein